MNIDDTLKFSDGQAVTTQTDNASDYTVDALGAGDMLAKPLFVNIDVDTACTSGGAATVVASLQTCAESTFASPTTLLASGAIPVASLVQGYRVLQGRVPGGVLRYLRVVYTVGVAALTAGKFNAFLTDGVDRSFVVK
jgi:hypothetical protein